MVTNAYEKAMKILNAIFDNNQLEVFRMVINGKNNKGKIVLPLYASVKNISNMSFDTHVVMNNQTVTISF